MRNLAKYGWNIDCIISVITRCSSYCTIPYLLWTLSGYSTNRPLIPLKIAIDCFALGLLLISVISYLNDQLEVWRNEKKPRLNATKDVILITGGSGGLGCQIVEQFLGKGFKVVVFDVCKPRWKELPKGLFFETCDVTCARDVEQSLDTVFQKIGCPTVLINNAGTLHGAGLLSESSVEEIERSLNVNLTSYFLVTRLILSKMIQAKKGSIVNIGSALGYCCPVSLAAYGAAKAGIIALHESLTYELRGPQYRDCDFQTLLFVPGQLTTDMFKSVLTPSTFFAPIVQVEKLADDIFRKINSGRSGTFGAPLYAKFLPFMRVIPSSFASILRSLSGVDKAMENYVPPKKDS